MDQQKLRNLVFEKTGVKVDSNDPIFALVALNETVLAETVERHVALIDAAAEQLAAQTRLLLDAGERYRQLHPASAPNPNDTPAAVPTTAANTATAASPAQPVTWRGIDRRLIVGAGAIALLSALLTVGLQWLFSR